MIIGASKVYNEDSPVQTYLETGNLSIYCQGPTGIETFVEFFKQIGTRIQIAYVKPFHWNTITKRDINKTHLLVIREPYPHHRESSGIHTKSTDRIEQKRNTMFYQANLQPTLGTLMHAEFDHFIQYERLKEYLFDFEYPSVQSGPELFSVVKEIDCYDWIRENKMELEPNQWRELIMRGQLEAI